MNEVVRILMRRDGYTKAEAISEYKDGMKRVNKLINEGKFIEAEDEFQSYFSLEPDYLMNAII